jgi:hypothetical protein
MPKFNRLSIAMAALFFASTSFTPPMSAAEPATTMSKQQVDTLLASGKFHRVKTKAEVPKVWWKAMELENLSDIGGPFDPGCTGNQPHRRLVAAALSEPYGVMVSEQGGIAYMTEFRVFKHEKDAVTSVYFENVREQRLREILKKLGQ